MIKNFIYKRGGLLRFIDILISHSFQSQKIQINLLFFSFALFREVCFKFCNCIESFSAYFTHPSQGKCKNLRRFNKSHPKITNLYNHELIRK